MQAFLNPRIILHEHFYAILTTDEASARFVEVGKGLRMVKPDKVDDENIRTHPKISPMKTKATELEIDFERIEQLSKQKRNIGSGKRE